MSSASTGDRPDESGETPDDTPSSSSSSDSASADASSEGSSSDASADSSGSDASGEDSSSGSDAHDDASAEDSSDMTDAFHHEDDDDSMDARAVDLGGACPLEPELPLLLYAPGRGGDDGELDAKEREKLEAHVRKCSRCEGAFAELQAAASALDKAPLVTPRTEKWSKLKSNVLARAAAAADAGQPAPAPAPVVRAVPKGRPPRKQPAAKTTSSTPSEAIAAMVCGAYEEDLLFLQDLEPARRAEVNAHLAACARCREAQVAFASVGKNLESVEVEWPSIDRWDALKGNVLAQCGIEAGSSEGRVATKKPALKPASPIVLETVTGSRRAGGFFFRAAAAVAVFALGVYASDALRSPGPDGIRRAYNEAGSIADLAVAQQNYELVVREGTARPELQDAVDDSLIQLAAIRRYNTAIASAALSPDAKRVELLNVIAQFPATRAARFAVAEYTHDLEQPSKVNVKVPYIPGRAYGGSGFTKPELVALDQPHLKPNPNVLVLWDAKVCAEKLVKLKDQLPEGEQREAQNVFVAAKFQQAIDAKTDPEIAKVDLKLVLEKTDSTSPLYLEARRRLDVLMAATGN